MSFEGENITDQQERLTRLEAIKLNAEWLTENWESADSQEIAKRLGLIKGDRLRLTEMASEKHPEAEDTEDS